MAKTKKQKYQTKLSLYGADFGKVVDTVLKYKPSKKTKKKKRKAA